MKMLLLIFALLLNFSVSSAAEDYTKKIYTPKVYTPKIAIEFIDDNDIYNPAIIQKLGEELNKDLIAEDKFIIVDKAEADYIVEGRLVGVGTGKLINNAMGTAFTFSGSAASLFVSPFASPVIGAVGFAQIRKNVFGVAVGIHVIRASDNEIVYKAAFLGRTNLKKADLSLEILNNTIKHASELITKRLSKDVGIEEPKIFVEPDRPKEKKFFIHVEGIS
ncbi:MAG: hypothetical protein IJ862_02680 [Selenomonadaceae bacterium]|nr:hypothetical protein [Selenomonadaceae bacterium]